MAHARGKPFRIIYIHNPANKAHRYRMSGILRYVSEHRDLVATGISTLTPSLAPTPILKQNLADEIRRRIMKNAPDGVISVRSVSFPPAKCRGERPPIPTILTNVPDTPESFDCPADAFGVLDDKAICRAAVDLAIRRGHMNFAYVDTHMPNEQARSDHRHGLYLELLAEHGHLLARYPEIDTLDDYAKLKNLSDWLDKLPKPCMVFAYADNRAQTVIDACHLAHLKVPEQINVIGVDNDTEICETIQPTLTSVLPDFEYGGYLAAKTLHEILRSGKRPKSPVIFRYGVKTLFERASTRDLRGGGRLVSHAQQIIADSFDQPGFGTLGLARRLNVSRQLLDLRFREIVGRTVHAEIERLRLAKAKALLERNDRSIGEILLLAGYTNPDTFRNAFKNATGLTPRDWASAGGRPAEGLISKTAVEPHSF